MKYFIYSVLLAAILSSCTSKNAADPVLLDDANLLHRNEKQLTEVIIYDVFSPPVASRIYMYTSLAAYEALRFKDPSYKSIAAQMNGFSALPVPDKNKSYNYLLAATKAFFTVAEKVTFSLDTLKKYENKVYDDFRSLLNEETFSNSISFGENVGKKILERAMKDNYKETRGMARFIGSNEVGKWKPTAPDYLDAAEPHWFRIKTVILDSPGQIQCPPPPPYDTNPNSAFIQTIKEVYNISNHLTDEQKEIAKYWDDNPFVIEHAGHMMYGNKKITPVGHWMGITEIACRKKKTTPVETAQVYALTSAAMFDAIISCWKTKFQYQHIRPITFINENMDPNWQPMLQTPAFPEHPSGHSAISASAATVLTKKFGDNFAFEDNSDFDYIGMKRNFQSFLQAASEASISRVYGGIHYRSGVDAGAIQGKEVGTEVVSRFLQR
jgi:hypothetical protein